MKFLKLLSKPHGVPGSEERIHAVIEKIKGVLMSGELSMPSGNLICIKHAVGGKDSEAAVRVMIAAHMDQIGFYVKHIDDKGFIRIHNAMALVATCPPIVYWCKAKRTCRHTQSADELVYRQR